MKSAGESKKSARARVFLVDDHPLVREWLAGMIALERDLEICGQAEEAVAAVATLPLAGPDIVVVDLTLPRGSGLELIKELRARFSAVRLLVLTTHDDVAIAERAFRAGAHGFVVKRESGEKIIEAIRTVLAGNFYASPSLAAQLTGRMFSGPARGTGSPAELLSDREMEVFRMRGEGRQAKEIADRLGVSVKTVGSYEARIKEKLGLENVTEVMREAMLWQDSQRGL
jgi:DNA-binding NarL/FixJ family response regulator